MENQQHLKDISEMRSLMERSSRFISLSGLSGVFAGIFAILGAAAAFMYMDYTFGWPERYFNFHDYTGALKIDVIWFLLFDAIIVLILALGFGIYFTTRNSRRKGLKIWDKTAKRMLINLGIPLVSGGLFCIALFYHGLVYLIAPATLIFYGLALVNASKYTLDDVKYLGISEIILGIVATVFAGYSIIFWTVGFGILHIVYGTFMYYKYER